MGDKPLKPKLKKKKLSKPIEPTPRAAQVVKQFIRHETNITLTQCSHASHAPANSIPPASLNLLPKSFFIRHWAVIVPWTFVIVMMLTGAAVASRKVTPERAASLLGTLSGKFVKALLPD